MQVVFEKTYVVDSRDADLFGRCRPSSLLGYLQDAATEHADALGVGRLALAEHYHCAWVLARQWYRLDRPLMRDDVVTVRTWTRGVKGALCHRDFDIFCNGKQIGESVTAWMMMDLETRRLFRMQNIPALVNPPLPSDCKDMELRKIRMSEELEEWMTRTVRYSDTDLNGHMNNTRYLDVACDAIHCEKMPQKYLHEVYVQYLHECLPGEIIIVSGKRDGDCAFLRGADSEKSVHFDMILNFLDTNEKS